MAKPLKLVQESSKGTTIGFVGLGLRAKKVGSPAQSAHDGDTVIGRALANVNVRFLGIDTPEVSFRLPGDRNFVAIKNPRWSTYLRNPFPSWGGAPLPQALLGYLKQKLGPKTASNHARHADHARRRLARLIQEDLEKYYDGQRDAFSFFIRYAHDALDRYGRLLGYLNVNVAKAEKRPLTYNERMLQGGLAAPYFIWPNTDPFKKQKRLLEAVFPPSDLHTVGDTGALGQARQWVKGARGQAAGIFEADNPLLLEPFELRFLAGQRPPDRWVIDLSGNQQGLIPPTEYFKVPLSEDRLFIPDEFVSLFRAKGW